ncbi:hypothetical protein chiPu_0008002 [Chiloscyllium punctatum]|uniref:Uncharacterized protein n=1 Tax=Chiloscyllium punctatum TaxID=137246 RepID=A0A401SGT8_CHIPU|nr:hypothetical protein [Chiloscyllium punctatum]
MVGLDEAEAIKKKEMKNEVEKLQTVHQNCISKQKNLEKSEAEIKTHVSELKGKLSKMFSEKRKQLNKDEKCALRLIDEHGNSLLSDISNNSATMHSMAEQMRLLNEKAQNLMQEDSISFIQKSAELLPKVVETQKLTFPDPPEPVLNLSNLSQFLNEWMEESEKAYSTREKLRQMHECTESTCGEGPAEPASVADTQMTVTDEKNLREARLKSPVGPTLAGATPIVIKLQSKVLKGFPRESEGAIIILRENYMENA